MVIPIQRVLVIRKRKFKLIAIKVILEETRESMGVRM
jgi:hypothetical protein